MKKMKEEIKIGYIRGINKVFLPKSKVMRDLSVLGFEGISLYHEKGFLADKNRVHIYVKKHRDSNILNNIDFWRNKVMTISVGEAYSINYDVSSEGVKRHLGNHIAKELKVEAIKEL